ncbi:LysR substrate-binding domain-containing protein [Rhodococcus sp. ARC_M6]|uniref:LysR substrate-binding domain-containing protein n=1 Tax=Rhodococcus sp. ARC_M6 TaxID=2928852 RepID=UPI001FB22387|nr:LysR substrate-binding domain-containing protein [Rhodococcus sp. ARC_M6]MCJ0904475.1 LysR substrate-binding domain-containing protein [Rhodococcus sp. ARC_M6]
MTRRWPDLSTLELLIGIDDHGSLSAASRLAHIAQPNASRAVKALERQLGMPLIHRRSTGATLTPQGTVIVHWARRVLDNSRQLLDVAEGMRTERSAELTVCASMTVAEHLIPAWLGSFRGLHPDVTVHLQVYNSTRVIEAIDAGTCDVGFIESPTAPRHLHSITVARDSLVVVVHPEHPWARRRKPLTAAELATTPLLVREPGSGTRTTLDLALQEYERAAPLLELGSSAAIRTSVLGGVGPAVLSTLAVNDQVKTGELRVVEVDGLVLDRTLRAVWRPPRQLEGPAGDLVKLVRMRSA